MYKAIGQVTANVLVMDSIIQHFRQYWCDYLCCYFSLSWRKDSEAANSLFSILCYRDSPYRINFGPNRPCIRKNATISDPINYTNGNCDLFPARKTSDLASLS
jgi:hypothetical protein